MLKGKRRYPFQVYRQKRDGRWVWRVNAKVFGSVYYFRKEDAVAGVKLHRWAKRNLPKLSNGATVRTLREGR